jgi:hypothetical protein
MESSAAEVLVIPGSLMTPVMLTRTSSGMKFKKRGALHHPKPLTTF